MWPQASLCNLEQMMADFTIFYAWQSDCPLDDNKHLIRDAAQAAKEHHEGCESGRCTSLGS